jgi:ribosome-associated protein
MPSPPGIIWVMDDPLVIRGSVAIPLREVTLRASRSSGPGGQHANVTDSRVEASFDVAASTALSEAQKQRVIARLGPLITAVAQDGRGQARNRELALERLRSRLAGALAVPRHRGGTRARRASRPSSATRSARRPDAVRPREIDALVCRRHERDRLRGGGLRIMVA